MMCSVEVMGSRCAPKVVNSDAVEVMEDSDDDGEVFQLDQVEVLDSDLCAAEVSHFERLALQGLGFFGFFGSSSPLPPSFQIDLKRRSLSKENPLRKVKRIMEKELPILGSWATELPGWHRWGCKRAWPYVPEVGTSKLLQQIEGVHPKLSEVPDPELGKQMQLLEFLDLCVAPRAFTLEPGATRARMLRLNYDPREGPRAIPAGLVAAADYMDTRQEKGVLISLDDVVKAIQRWQCEGGGGGVRVALGKPGALCAIQHQSVACAG
ncbi:hypothetical protein SELMODRAFT_421411 [Selaginella moellendorffii]|uniref:Uncharacterized protein n=1 Tax=Selaginella moellendorffii TaxID=88036 RepID=D8SF72_SELML|nr:hypothetical protein SELMODRAFT_421411 [Selaginella moellendorffii]